MQNFIDGKVPVQDNKVSTLMEFAKVELKDTYKDEELTTICWWLLEHFTGISQHQFHQQPQAHVNQSSIIYFCNGVVELKKGTPIQYVTGVVEFYGLHLNINSSVLIPRPETEELADIIVKENKEREGLKILDIGTGSGCLALSLAYHLPDSKVTALDISPAALKLAEENAKKNNISNIEFLEMNILEEDYFISKEFDLMVSNPPYIALSEKESMAANVVNFEPAEALFVPENDPLIFYKAIGQMGHEHLKRNGLIYVEINESLGKETSAIFTQDSFSSVILMTDMFGKNRFIKAVKI